MQTLTKPIAAPSRGNAWSKALARPAIEFPLTSLTAIAGKIPQGLRGTFYRNGPGRLHRGSDRVGHWFDGDGAILAVHFTNEGATATYRYVQTTGYQEEETADRFLFPSYGMTAPGAFWNSWGKAVKNVANTSVLALGDRLLALWEGGHPYALDLKTLKTWGTDDLEGLQPMMPFSAHPKIDPQTGEIYNFGISPGPRTTLNVYRSDATGIIRQKGSVPLSGLPLVHDFIFAGPYLIFLISPVRVDFLPVLLGMKSYSDALQWQPELGTQILVLDRATLSPVSRGTTEPWFQWHFTNSYVDERGWVVTEMVAYSDFHQTNQYIKEAVSGRTQTPAKGTLWQVRLDPHRGKIIDREELFDRGGEFPVVEPQQAGQPWRYTYLLAHREGASLSKDMFGAIARFDRKTGTAAIADVGDNCYPSEPMIAGQWLLSVVYDGNRLKSEVWIWDRDRLEEEPLCKLELPEAIPLGFHGTWKPA